MITSNLILIIIIIMIATRLNSSHIGVANAQRSHGVQNTADSIGARRATFPERLVATINLTCAKTSP